MRDAPAQSVKSGHREVLDALQLSFEARRQRPTVTRQKSLPSSRGRSERFLDCHHRFASPCATPDERSGDIGDHVEDMVLGRFKNAELRVGFCKSSADVEAERERMRQQPFQRSDAVVAQSLAIVWPLPCLQSVVQPSAKSMLQLARTTEDRGRSISSEVAGRRACTGEDHSMGGMNEALGPSR
jgi:hypothetical protein